MLNELLAIAGACVLLAGLALLAAGTYKAVHHFLWWAQQWKLRREGRKQYAAKGWNPTPEEMPEGKYVVAIWEGWRPEIGMRRGDWFQGQGVGFQLNGCVGWAELPPT